MDNVLSANKPQHAEPSHWPFGSLFSSSYATDKGNIPTSGKSDHSEVNSKAPATLSEMAHEANTAIHSLANYVHSEIVSKIYGKPADPPHDLSTTSSFSKYSHSEVSSKPPVQPPAGAHESGAISHHSSSDTSAQHLIFDSSIYK